MKAKIIIALLLAAITLTSGCTQEKQPGQQVTNDGAIMDEIDSGWEDSTQNMDIGNVVPDDATTQDSGAGQIDEQVGSAWAEETDSVNIGEMY